MKYNPPFGATDPDAPFVNGIPGIKKGSAVPAGAVEHPQREIMAVIYGAIAKGLDITPDSADLTQLWQSLQFLFDKTAKPFFVGEFYYFRHPTLRPGFVPAQGGVVNDVDEHYPEIWEYLQTPAGQLLCKTEAQWQAMSTAVEYTLADGTTVGWNGIGGAPFFVLDLGAKTLRVPDVRGMYAEAAGFDALDVGGSHLDMIRNIAGGVGPVAVNKPYVAEGAIYVDSEANTSLSATASSPRPRIYFNAGRVVPIGNAVKTRAWGALACVYLGAPR